MERKEALGGIKIPSGLCASEPADMETWSDKHNRPASAGQEDCVMSRGTSGGQDPVLAIICGAGVSLSKTPKPNKSHILSGWVSSQGPEIPAWRMKRGFFWWDWKGVFIHEAMSMKKICQMQISKLITWVVLFKMQP